MGNGKESAPLELANLEDVWTYYPKQWVAVEIQEVTEGVGITRARVIAHGRRSAEQAVLAGLARFRQANPDNQFGLFYTGPMVRPGQDIIVAAR